MTRSGSVSSNSVQAHMTHMTQIWKVRPASNSCQPPSNDRFKMSVSPGWSFVKDGLTSKLRWVRIFPAAMYLRSVPISETHNVATTWFNEMIIENSLRASHSIQGPCLRSFVAITCPPSFAAQLTRCPGDSKESTMCTLADCQSSTSVAPILTTSAFADRDCVHRYVGLHTASMKDKRIPNRCQHILKTWHTNSV